MRDHGSLVAERAATDDAPVALARPTGAVGDSLAVALWTIVSRVTGLGRVVTIAAVLGPTYLGNTFQLTNSFPNLVYYGFLGGSLFSSLLVPALVRHIDQGDRRATERVAGGFFGMAMLVLVGVTPVVIALGPLVMKVVALGVHDRAVAAAQESVGRWLILMLMPQVVLYGVVGSASAVMNARRRFALAAAAPALENIGMIAVLLAAAARFGMGTSLEHVETGELLLLGLGTTGAVGLHATAQWLGAWRAGVVLRPRAGWRDPEVMEVVGRALHSLLQAGLIALQLLVVLVVANRVPGGVVAFQLALNFCALSIALGVTPVALSLLPRLSRLYYQGEAPLFHDTLMRGFAFAFFLTIPAAVAYLTLSIPLAQAVSVAKMNSPLGTVMVAASLAALAPGVIGETAFLLMTYASYSRQDTRSPLRSMTVRLAVCLCLVGCALLLQGTAVLVTLGLAVSASNLVGAWHLTSKVRRHLRGGRERLAPSLIRIGVGAAVMVAPAWAAWLVAHRWIEGQLSSVIGVVAASVLGGGAFFAIQALMHAPELAWVAGGVGYLRGKPRGHL